MKKKLIALMLVLVLVLGCLAACGTKTEEPAGQSGTETPSTGSETKTEEPPKDDAPKANNKPASTSREENALRMPIYPAYETFDPNHVDGGAELQIYPAIYECLCWLNPDGDYVPVLCKSYELTEDGAGIRFELRDDVYFHNGEHMTADDVVYSHDRTELSIQIGYVFDYTVWTKIDDYTVEVRSVDPDAVSIIDLAPYVFRTCIFCRSWCEAISDDPKTDLLLKENGTGPYYIADIDVATKDVTLKKFDKYYGTAYIDTIYCKAITGDHEMIFESGDIDYARYTPTNLPLIEEYDNVYVHPEFSGEQWYLINNCGRAPMNDINVRKAMILALDRDEIGDVATDGSGVTSWNLVTTNLKGYFDVTEHLNDDPEQARELMRAAGYSETNPARVVYVSVKDNGIGEVLKERLEQCYFEVTIESTTDLTRCFAGDYDIMSVTLQLDGINDYNLLWNDGFGIAHDNNEELSDAILNAHTDEEYKQIQIDMFNEYAYVPLSMPTSFYVFDSGLEIVEDYLKPFTAIDFLPQCLRWKD